VHLEKCTSMYIDLFPIIFIVLSSNYSTVLYVAIQLQLANTSSGSRQYSKIVINVLCFAVNILHDYLFLFIYIIYILCLFFFRLFCCVYLICLHSFYCIGTRIVLPPLAPIGHFTLYILPFALILNI
jgi:hypothetical protein